MIKYLGSKRLLVPRITRAVAAMGEQASVLDLFSGTSRVGHALKRAGHFVTANDHLRYAATLARCYVEADAREIAKEAEARLEELGRVPPEAGYFTRTFCEEARFFHPSNGARIDAMRSAIERMGLGPVLEAVLLTALMEAADRVDSTTGVQMAYLKHWAARAEKPLSLRLPELLPGRGLALELEAKDAARQVDADVAYLDPPYNQHSYKGNYHVWETLMRWDAPETYGVARKRTDCRTYKNPFNQRRGIRGAMEEVLGGLRARRLLVSFSNEGYLAEEELREMLAGRGYVGVHRVDYKRYVGAQIGIYNPSGERVGAVSHLRNQELLFVVAESRAVVDRALRAMDAAADQAAALSSAR